MDSTSGARPAKEPLPGWSLGIRPIAPDDHEDIVEFLSYHWGSTRIVSRGRLHDASRLPGFIAPSMSGDLNGLITLHIDEGGCEIVTMNSVYRGRGIGTHLMACAEIYAREHGRRRLWLVTTNDNTDAFVFYQRRGFRMRTIYRDAILEARRLKPSIPEIGEHGIPILDELEFEKMLEG